MIEVGLLLDLFLVKLYLHKMDLKEFMSHYSMSGMYLVQVHFVKSSLNLIQF